jgi:UDP:flavonoid glycosyltransferase YjiC (YdhE family)
VPTTWDKPDNARRVTEVGAGIRLSPKKCSPEAVREAVATVLTDPAYRRNASRIGALLRAAPGPRRAAELIEEVTATAAVSPGAPSARRPLPVPTRSGATS